MKLINFIQFTTIIISLIVIYFIQAPICIIGVIVSMMLIIGITQLLRSS